MHTNFVYLLIFLQGNYNFLILGNTQLLAVFTYGPPHNVYKVDGAGFKDCKPSGDLYSTGNDTFTLMKSGKKWYICGYNDHCQKGQKLVINVESNGPVPAPIPAPTATPTATPSPTPASNDSYRSFVLSWYQIFLAAIVTMVVAAF